MITNFFIPELNNHDVQELWFQQDGATCHTARATIDLLKDTFGDRLISRFGPVNWPLRSCDLTPLDYFLWGYVKSLVYADKTQTLDHLEDNIRRVIADIRPQMLEKVIENWTSRLDYIRASRGSPMPEIIFKMYKFNKDQVLHALPTVDVRGTVLERDCPLTVDFPCRPKKYRAYSGYCNNVQNPRWGNANTAYVRYLSPDYSNSVNSPRQSTTGGHLPGAHHVSSAVHSDSERPHPHLTVFLAIFAEFVFHDIFHTSQSAGYRGHRIRCCGVPKNFLHPECYPIVDDNVTNKQSFCVNYVRSSNVPRAGCTLGPREQINQVTSFLDGSAIYGSSEEEVKRLRTYKHGLLKTQEGLELLPPDTSNPHDCRESDSRHKCFLAGDVRVNENVGLMVMHTLWVREHNRIARKLSEVNPHWTDDHLFEETRRIVGAELQHVTYSELLPTLLGTQVIRQFDLQPREDSEFYHGYDINLNPGTSNAFAASVGASFYSMMPSHFFLYSQTIGLKDRASPKHDTVGSMQISETHFHPEPLYNEGTLDQVLLGMTNQNAQSMDEFITREMNNNLLDDAEERPVRHGGTLNSRRAASPLVRLVKGKNWGETELNRSVTCMVFKATANDKRHLALCHDEFRGP
ncbi:peroxidasin-like protein [Trichonephila clavipes]|nr:peroxidasin-like protein [Trichonephila clavipes]